MVSKLESLWEYNSAILVGGWMFSWFDGRNEMHNASWTPRLWCQDIGKRPTDNAVRSGSIAPITPPAKPQQIVPPPLATGSSSESRVRATISAVHNSLAFFGLVARQG